MVRTCWKNSYIRPEERNLALKSVQDAAVPCSKGPQLIGTVIGLWAHGPSNIFYCLRWLTARQE